MLKTAASCCSSSSGSGASDVFELVYLGVGQRVGPDPAKPPTNFADFLKFMQGKFWDMHDMMFQDQNRLSVKDLKAAVEAEAEAKEKI